MKEKKEHQIRTLGVNLYLKPCKTGNLNIIKFVTCDYRLIGHHIKKVRDKNEISMKSFIKKYQITDRIS